MANLIADDKAPRLPRESALEPGYPWKMQGELELELERARTCNSRRVKVQYCYQCIIETVHLFISSRCCTWSVMFACEPTASTLMSSSCLPWRSARLSADTYTLSIQAKPALMASVNLKALDASQQSLYLCCLSFTAVHISVMQPVDTIALLSSHT